MLIQSPPLVAIFQSIGWPEMLIIGAIALLIFGRRLPEVGRSLGKGIVEFKKGLKDAGDEISKDVDHSDSTRAQNPNQDKKVSTASSKEFNEP